MNLWSWIFFPRPKVFERSGRRPSSGDNVPRGRPRAICIIRARSVIISCARSVYEPFIIRARSVRDSCIFLRSLCARCFHRSRVRTPAFSMRSFCRSRVRFLGPIACLRPVKSLAYVTRPHEWSNRWHRKQKKLLWR